MPQDTKELYEEKPGASGGGIGPVRKTPPADPAQKYIQRIVEDKFSKTSAETFGAENFTD